MNKHQLLVKKFDQPKKRICANHPVSPWKDGYKQCYWGFKLNLVETYSGKPQQADKGIKIR